MRRCFLLPCLLVLGAALALGCSATGGDEEKRLTDTTSAAQGGANGATTSTADGGNITVGPGSGGSGAANEVAEVYGHSADTLYKLDPITNQVTVIGPFNGCSGVIDLALDKDSNVFATTFGGLHTVDKNSASCAQVQAGQYPNSLSFVPEGTVNANSETLVGYYFSDYVSIDTTSGMVTTIGQLSGGFASSGDIVSVKGGGTYLTVTGPGCGTDCLLEVNPSTGDIVQNWGPVGYNQVFGLAFWGGSAFGFSNAGDLFEINFGPSNVTTTVITIPNAPPGLQFWGAGSSTSAPLTPPS